MPVIAPVREYNPGSSLVVYLTIMSFVLNHNLILETIPKKTTIVPFAALFNEPLANSVMVYYKKVL